MMYLGFCNKDMFPAQACKQDFEKQPPEMAAPFASMFSVGLHWFKV